MHALKRLAKLMPDPSQADGIDAVPTGDDFLGYTALGERIHQVQGLCSPCV